MSHPKELLNAALKDALKNKDNNRRDILRLFTSAVKQFEVDTRTEATPEQVIEILNKEAKKRRESIEELERAGRPEQAAAEKYELSILGEFLPSQLSEAELRTIVQEAIKASGVTDVREMGKVMGIVNPQTKGRADGKLVSNLVRELLST